MGHQRLERIKILSLFSSVLLISCILGAIMANYISSSSYANYMFLISTHFETAFLDSSGFVDCARIVTRYALPDIISVLAVFAASFSICNYLITNVVLIYNGLKIGLSIAFLAQFNANNGLYTVGNTKVIIFALIEFITLLLILYYSYRSALSSVALRRTDQSGRPNLKTKDFLQFASKTLACIGGVLILNALYCAFIYILK